MTLVRRIARPMLASMFLVGGLDALRNPSSKAETAQPVVDKIRGPLGLPDDTELMVRANGAAMVAGGALLALGKFPRIAGLTLTATLVPTTLAGHRFWEETDKAAKQKQMAQFFKNVSMMGGTLLVAVDTDGKPSLVYRAKSVGGDVERSAKSGRRAARRAARSARREAKLRAA